MQISNSEPILRMEHIQKSFPGVLALKGVDFSLNRGEVHVLMGANGAGKSTLMKVLSGAYVKDSGVIIIDGKEVSIQSTKDAQKLGISIIHQHFSQAQHLSVAENIFLGREKIKHGLIDYEALYDAARKALETVAVDINVKARIMDLSVSQKQIVEIAKALSFDSRILIMDEPTSALSKKETQHLFSIIRRLTEKGIGIVYISHRLDELSDIGDRVTVMKDGLIVGTRNIGDVEMRDLVRMMVGRSVEYTERLNVDAIDFNDRENILELKSLYVENTLHDISMHIKRGEIVGLYGLMGSGRTELARAVFGVDPISSGEMILAGDRVRIRSPEDAVHHKIGFLPEDRLKDGLALTMEVGENITLPNLDAFSHHGVMNLVKESRIISNMIDKLNIKTPSAKTITKNLSGGNQQKVVFAKWILAGSKLLLLDDPTQGVDVGAIAEVHDVILDYAKNQNNAVLLISSEINEILQLSDRIYIIHDGRLVDEIDGKNATKEIVMESAFSGNRIQR